MKEKRFYYDGSLSTNAIISLEGDEFHHLAQVMRAKTGDRVCLFNGNGSFYFGEIKSLTKKQAEILITEEKPSANEPKIKITLYQALAKGEKLSLIMQKITELGAYNLKLFESEYCDVKAKENKQERMNQISAQAAKQCGRASIVESSGIYKIKDIADQIKDYDAFFVAYENEDGHTLADSLLSFKSQPKNVAIMIGAEGGFATNEIKILKQNGADIVSLGTRILRTETAAIACVALLSSLLDK